MLSIKTIILAAFAITASLLPQSTTAIHIPHNCNHNSKHFNNDNNNQHWAPIHRTPEDAIENKYIVILRSDVKYSELMGHYRWLSELLAESYFVEDVNIDGDILEKTFDFNGKLKGYSGRFTPESLNLLRSQPVVAYIEQDREIRLDIWEGPITKQQDDDNAKADFVILPHTQSQQYLVKQSDAPWGLSRVSHKTRPADDVVSSEYIHRSNVGEGVTVYVVDTGIAIEHPDFEGRALWGVTIPAGDADVDGNGHGTHCAGTIAGKRFGVAKNARVV
ncbi:serine protease, partial [Blyttiomyces sp. JEL0837]